MALESLVLKLAADVGTLERDLGKAQRLAEKKAQAMKASFAKVGKGIAQITGASALAGSALLGIAVKGVTAADKMAKAARAAGLTAEQFQELTFAAQQSGVQSKQLEEGMRRLNRRFGEFINSGGGPAAKAFETLGIAAKTTEGKVKSTDQVFNEIVDRMQGIETQAGKAALASQLFGDDAGPKLALLLAQGSEATQALRDEAQAYGLVSNESALASEAAADAIGRISTASSNLVTNLGVSLAPMLEKIANWLAAALPAGIKILIGAINRMRALWLGAVNAILDKLADLLEFFADVEDSLRSLAEKVPGIDDLGRPLGEAAESARKFQRATAELADYYDNRAKQVFDAAFSGYKKIRDAINKVIPPVKEAEDETKALAIATEAEKKAAEAAAKAEDKRKRALRALIDQLDPAAAKARELVENTQDLADAHRRHEIDTERYIELLAELRKQYAGAEEEAEDYSDALAQLIDRLNPAAAAARQYTFEATLLARAQADGKLTAEEFAAEIRKLKAEYLDTGEAARTAADDIEDWGHVVGTVFGQMEGDAGMFARAIANIAVNWKQLNAVADNGNLAEQLMAGAQVGQQLSFVGAGALGPGQSRQLGSTVGGAAGMAIGALYGLGAEGAVLGSLIGGGLFGDFGEENTRIQVRTGRAQSAAEAGADPRFFQRTALGLSVSGERITQATGNASEYLRALVRVDEFLASIADVSNLVTRSGLQNTLAGPASGGGRLSSEFLNTSPAQAAVERLNTALTAFDTRVQSLVGTITQAEDGFKRIGAAVELVSVLDSNIVDVVAEAVRIGGLSGVEALAEQGVNLVEQAVNFNGTTSGLEALASAASAFQQAAINALLQIEQVRGNIGTITANTRSALEFQRITDPAEQQEFLLRRARDLAAGVGSAGSAAEVQRQIALVNQLISQIAGIGGADFLNNGGFAQLDAILTQAETGGQQRLNELETIVQDTFTQAIDEVGAQLGEVATTMNTAAVGVNNGADVILLAADRFGVGVDGFSAAVTPLVVEVRTGTGGEVG